MNLLTATILLVGVIGVLRLPRSWLMLPLLFITLYSTMSQYVDIGPITLTLHRIVFGVALLKCYAKGYFRSLQFTLGDRLMVAWGVWIVICPQLRPTVGEGLVFYLGLCCDGLIGYFVMRVVLADAQDVKRAGRLFLLLLIPVAAEMLFEKTGGTNLFWSITGANPAVNERGDKIRAYGAFAHPILAGTVGAVALPFAIYWWRESRIVGAVGVGACSAVIIASASSGPILAALTGLSFQLFYPFRRNGRAFLGLGICLLIVLSLIMEAPIYYLLDRIDLTGGSTGWHRAALIDASLRHFDEWCLLGTDFTRHWMPTGVSWSQNHTDITNYYIKSGVYGGMPLLLILLAAIGACFTTVARELARASKCVDGDEFLPWTLGAILFGHATTFISVTYFDQSITFFYFSMACIYGARPRGSALFQQAARSTTP